MRNRHSFNTTIMLNIQHRYIIGALVCVALLAVIFRDYFGLLTLIGLSLLPGLIPLVVALAIGVVVVRSVRQPQTIFPHNHRAIPGTSPVPTPSPTPLAQRLQTAFRRNQAAQLDQALATLPTWPITHRVRETARVLLALKQSIYRAQIEGVPAPIVQRYLGNTIQAADALWELASKLDALGQQRIAYELVALQLLGEEQRLAQLHQSAQAAQEGIALLIVSGIQSDAFQKVDEDLSALTQAVKRVTVVRP